MQSSGGEPRPRGAAPFGGGGAAAAAGGHGPGAAVPPPDRGVGREGLGRRRDKREEPVVDLSSCRRRRSGGMRSFKRERPWPISQAGDVRRQRAIKREGGPFQSTWPSIPLRPSIEVFNTY